MGPHVDESLMSSATEGELKQQCSVARKVSKDINDINNGKKTVTIDIVIEKEQPKQTKENQANNSQRQQNSNSNLKRPSVNRHRSSSLSELSKSLNLLQIDDTLTNLRRYHSSNFDAETHVDDSDGLLTTSLCTTEL